MNIIEQVEELREYEQCKAFPQTTRKIFEEAADTIESLSAKLADMERSKERNKKMLRYGFCPDCGAPVGRDASSCFECGAVLDWDLIKDMDRTSENCGGGWIYCGDGKNLPEESVNSVIGWDEYRNRCCFVQYWGGRWILGNDVDSVKIVAWMPTPTKPRYAITHGKEHCKPYQGAKGIERIRHNEQ